ncbi:MAG: hypothetical protein AAGD05_01905 [Bacteroidota bacterium]
MMYYKRFFFSSSLLLFMTLLLGGWMPNSWQEFISYEGKFKVLTPGEMITKTNEIETAIGNLTYHTFLHQPEDKTADNLVYMVSYCDYPPYTISSDSTELVNDFFTTTIESAVSSVKGVLRYSSEIQLGNYPGRLWRIDYGEGSALIKTKAYLIGQRYYSIQTITLKDRSLNGASDFFLDSFHLIE